MGSPIESAVPGRRGQHAGPRGCGRSHGFARDSPVDAIHRVGANGSCTFRITLTIISRVYLTCGGRSKAARGACRTARMVGGGEHPEDKRSAARGVGVPEVRPALAEAS
eukprot:scaffold207_cov409-Prasinococcus_capsulatus_cf.AAC.137